MSEARSVMSPSSGRQHIMPCDDLRKHEPYVTCWCAPTEHDEEPDLWIHHSMDRREEYEEGRKVS